MTSVPHTFHHLGLAVADDSAAVRFLRWQGYEIGPCVEDPEQGVRLRLCTAAPEPAVEIIMPGDGDGPLTPLLKRNREMVYHVCYEVAEPESFLEELRRRKLRVISVTEPKPAVLFGGRQVSFHRIVGFGLIELLAAGR
jgi:methylmalonyl-CoA/ethylmalonyl-CoA epimerase